MCGKQFVGDITNVWSDDLVWFSLFLVFSTLNAYQVITL